MNNKKYHYVYLTTNIINGKQYIGEHSSDTLNDGYIGSGRPTLKNAIKLYGKNNFNMQILEFFGNKQDAFNAQEKYIVEYNTMAPYGYNISPKGGHMYKGSVSENSKQLMSISKMGNKNPMFGKEPGNKGKKMTFNQIKKMKEHKFSEEHKKHLSESHKGQIPWNKGIRKQKSQTTI